jgi:hypothetical protein
MDPLGYIPSAEAEANVFRQLETATEALASTQTNQPPRFPGRYTAAEKSAAGEIRKIALLNSPESNAQYPDLFFLERRRHPRSPRQ